MEKLRLGDLIQTLHSLLTIAAVSRGGSDSLSLKIKMAIHTHLDALSRHCEQLGLVVPAQNVKDARTILADPNGGMKDDLLSKHLNMLVKNIEIELRGRPVLSLSPQEAGYFSPSQPPFGEGVQSKFSSITYEVDEAGKCLALERSTASAFHSIRCLEAAIRAISRCLGVPDPTKGAERSWAKALGKIKEETDRRWPTSGRLYGDGKIFEELYAVLQAMQNPYRNSTMHLDQKYTTEEARHLFENVKVLMKKVASRCDEEGNPLA